MTMPFSRPGAVDLSALKQPAPRPGAAAPSAGGAARYSVEADDQNFQSLLEASMTAPVVLVVHSPSRMPASTQLADDLATLAEELDGRILVARVDADVQGSILQALQVQSVPFAAMVLQGRLAPLLQDAPPLEELRAMMGQLVQQLAGQGMTGRHEPRGGEAPADDTDGADGPQGDPRYAAAEDALVAGDLDTAVAEYEKLIAADPADTEATVGLFRARLMQRTQGVDLTAARAAAADAPDDVEAQILVADLDLLGGHVEDAFRRLIDAVRRLDGDQRTAARLHLIELFAVVGDDDPRVLRGRRDLASALF